MNFLNIYYSLRMDAFRNNDAEICHRLIFYHFKFVKSYRHFNLLLNHIDNKQKLPLVSVYQMHQFIPKANGKMSRTTSRNTVANDDSMVNITLPGPRLQAKVNLFRLKRSYNNLISADPECSVTSAQNQTVSDAFQ